MQTRLKIHTRLTAEAAVGGVIGAVDVARDLLRTGRLPSERG